MPSLAARLLHGVERVREEVHDGVVERLRAAPRAGHVALDDQREPVARGFEAEPRRRDSAAHHRLDEERRLLVGVRP